MIANDNTGPSASHQKALHLVIRNSGKPFQDFHVQSLFPSSTVRDLKNFLIENYPHSKLQHFRLIFAGKYLVDDNALLKKVFDGFDPSHPHTIHLIQTFISPSSSSSQTPQGLSTPTSAPTASPSNIFSSPHNPLHTSQHVPSSNPSTPLTAPSGAFNQQSMAYQQLSSLTPQQQEQFRNFILQLQQQQQQQQTGLNNQQQQQQQQQPQQQQQQQQPQQQQQQPQQDQQDQQQAPAQNHIPDVPNGGQHIRMQDIWNTIIKLSIFAFLLTANQGWRKWLQVNFLFIILFIIFKVLTGNLFRGDRGVPRHNQDENAMFNAEGGERDDPEGADHNVVEQQQVQSRGFFGTIMHVIYLFFVSFSPSWQPSRRRRAPHAHQE